MRLWTRGGGGANGPVGPHLMRTKFEAGWVKGSPAELSDIPRSATAVLE